MVTVFADNQSMTAKSGTPSVIYTDPVALGNADRAIPFFMVHALWAWGGGAAATLAYQGQVSNDGVNWVDATGCDDDTTTPTTTPQVLSPPPGVFGAFIRFKFTLTVDSGDLAGATFDLHVKLDHA